MPKQKSHKGLLKRIKVTGRNKVKHRRRGKSHLNSQMSGGRSSKLRRKLTMHKTTVKRLERVLNMRLLGRDEEPKAKKTETKRGAKSA